jgi:hypothetical protein
MSRFRQLIATLCVAFTAAVFTAAPVFAQGFTADQTGLNAAAKGAGYNTNQTCTSAAGGCIPQLLGQIVSGLLGVVGALFLILMLYGGVQYMTAGGDKGKVEKAIATIRNAILGLLIITASYAITTFVFQSLGSVTTGVTGTGGTGVVGP